MTGAELVDDCSRDAWNGKLEDLLPDFDLNVLGEIEVGSGQHDWAVLEDEI